MLQGLAAPWRVLARLEEIPNRGCRGFAAAAGGFTGLFAVRWDDTVWVYYNSCPHVGLPLDAVPHRFLNADGSRIVCSAHGAEFRVNDGLCVLGPCAGDQLESVPVHVVDGQVWVPEDAGL